MVWTGITITSFKHAWRYLLIGLALTIFLIYLENTTGATEKFDLGYNIIFWMFFAVFWGCILWFILEWIIKKAMQLFRYFFPKQPKKEITYTYDLSKFKDGNPDDINPAWMMR